jgi:hypothetical protein
MWTRKSHIYLCDTDSKYNDGSEKREKTIGWEIRDNRTEEEVPQLEKA